jgi:hypothetical protein
MHQISRLTIPGILALGIVAFGMIEPAAAQGTVTPPGLPPAPTPAPGVPGPYTGVASENYLVTSAANEQGSYLWIVAPVQHYIILCQKLGDSKDFSCNSKRMP